MAVCKLLKVHSRILELVGGWDRYKEVLRNYAEK
jgi:hypothetical protein